MYEPVYSQRLLMCSASCELGTVTLWAVWAAVGRGGGVSTPCGSCSQGELLDALALRLDVGQLLGGLLLVRDARRAERARGGGVLSAAEHVGAAQPG